MSSQYLDTKLQPESAPYLPDLEVVKQFTVFAQSRQDSSVLGLCQYSEEVMQEPTIVADSKWDRSGCSLSLAIPSASDSLTYPMLVRVLDGEGQIVKMRSNENSVVQLPHVSLAQAKHSPCYLCESLPAKGAHRFSLQVGVMTSQGFEAIQSLSFSVEIK